MPDDLHHQRTCQLRVALELPRRCPRRYWLMRATRRELRTLARIDQERQSLRRVWTAIQAEIAAMHHSDEQASGSI